MANNRTLGDVELVLDGTSYTLRLDFNALCEVEEATGRPAAEVMSGSVSLRNIRLVLWAAMQRHHPDLTLIEAGDLLDGRVDEIMDALMQSLAASVPTAATEGGAGKSKVGRRRR